MKVVVTGATGLIGSHLLSGLLLSDHEVWAIARRPPAARATTRVHWVTADLRAPTLPESLPQQADVVIHLAQSAYHREFPEHALDVFEVNVGSTARLLDWSRSSGVRHFVLASSGGVGTANHMSHYIASKRCAELLAESYRGSFALLILRFFFVYGRGQKPSMLIPRLCRAIEDGSAITLAGVDGPRLNPVYVNDAVSALVRAVEATTEGTIDIAGPEVLSLRAMADTIAARLALPVRYQCEAGTAAHDVIGDIATMKEHLAIPEWTFGQGIADLVHEERKGAR